MSRLLTKPAKWHLRPAKTQLSLGIRPIWSETSQWAQWVAEDPMFLHADSEDSGKTGRMPRLIWVFARRTRHFVWFCLEVAYINVFQPAHMKRALIAGETEDHRKAFTVRVHNMSRLMTKPTKWLCAQRRSAWASVPSDQSFRCLLNW